MITCLLWDFGDTLFDELSLWRKSEAWMEVYRSFDDEHGIGTAWSLGEMETPEVARRIADMTSMSVPEVLAHLADASCFEAFPNALACYRARHLPQAIVTVNPADFRRLADDLALAEFVETIVISGEDRTVDKGELCTLALERMTSPVLPSEALLIDNKRANLVAWAACGGLGYLFVGDEAFGDDMVGGIQNLPLFHV